jgi:hypothetical protein
MTAVASTHSIIKDILDDTVKKQSGGLDFAAYAVATNLPENVDDTKGRYKLKIMCESRNPQLGSLLEKFACESRTPDEQFKVWQDLLHKVDVALRRLDRDFINAGQGENVRVVFDVDMGGFYYTRLTSNAVLFGAALDQAEVNNGRCEMEMHGIVAQIQAVFTVHGV